MIVEVGDQLAQLVALLFKLELFELREAPQLHVEDGCGLDLAQLEASHRACRALRR